MLVRHLRAQSPQGKLIRITLAWWQLVVGVSSPLLETTNTLIPHLAAPHWLSSMRSFLTQMDASIYIAGLTTTLPLLLRENDDCIKNVVLSPPDISKAHLRAFNRCRIFLESPTFWNSVQQTAPASHVMPGRVREAGCRHYCGRINPAQGRHPFGYSDGCWQQPFCKDIDEK
jgi:hypothetical protein